MSALWSSDSQSSDGTQIGFDQRVQYVYKFRDLTHKRSHLNPPMTEAVKAQSEVDAKAAEFQMQRNPGHLVGVFHGGILVNLGLAKCGGQTTDRSL
jgi:hypothetical protein